jgi:large subunit ribosomal protein L32
MACPKKTWRRKADVEALKAISLGKSILSGRSNFVYPTDEEEEGEE